MKKTKICCLNLAEDIIKDLSKTFEVYNGSLGKLVDVQYNNQTYNNTYLLLNYNFPNNIQEYEIFISDLANHKTISYRPDDHQNNNLTDDYDYRFVSHKPATLFNPIPYSCSLLKLDVQNDNKQKPIINIIFQYKIQRINYVLRDIAHHYSEDENYTETNYSLTKDFTEEDLYGKEIQISNNKTADTLFEKFSDEIEYYQTFYQPTIWDYETKQNIPDDNFIPLLTNKYNQIISYIWISDKEITFMLPQLKSKKELLDILFKEVLFKHYSEYFPDIETISWKNKKQYYLPEQQNLENKKQDIIDKYQEDIENIDKTIKDNNKKYEFLHGILTETGDKLVKNVIKYLKWLGFDNAIEKDKSAIDGLFEEDIQIDLGEKGLLIIEVKGLNGTSKDSECSQISKIRHRRCKERNKLDVIALYIVNNERNIEPLKRTLPPFNDNQIQDAINDDRGLMYTWQLFNLYFNIENGFISKEEARKCILNTGLIDFTPNLIKLGKPYKYYQDHTIICIDLHDQNIKIGDTLAYETNGKHHPIKVIEIQQEGKSFDEITNGKVGIKVDQEVPEIKMLYLKQ